MSPAQFGVPVWRAALFCRCPRCGKAPLFAGLLTVRDRCPSCGLDLRRHDTGDGPAVLVMFVLCVIVFGLAAWVELSYSPPFWVHLVIWPPLTAVLAIALMRPLKAGLVALQFRLRPEEMGL
jgi:uncharacterized protein (DUF983 family)